MNRLSLFDGCYAYGKLKLVSLSEEIKKQLLQYSGIQFTSNYIGYPKINYLGTNFYSQSLTKKNQNNSHTIR